LVNQQYLDARNLRQRDVIRNEGIGALIDSGCQLNRVGRA
jgi:hypothetical protein